jgi:hypothetical protein
VLADLLDGFHPAADAVEDFLAAVGHFDHDCERLPVFDLGRRLLGQAIVSRCAEWSALLGHDEACEHVLGSQSFEDTVLRKEESVFSGAGRGESDYNRE